MCKNCLISAVAAYFSIYFLITALTKPIWNAWVYSLVITALVCIATIACHMGKEGWKCCMPLKPAKPVKAKKR